MTLLVDPDKAPRHFGIALAEEDGYPALVAVSWCCKKRVQWDTAGNKCSQCKVTCVERGFTDNSMYIYENGDSNRVDSDLDKWVKAWTGHSDVKVSVE